MTDPGIAQWTSPHERFQTTMKVAGEWMLLIAIFLAAYITWRPVPDLLFTISDALFLGALSVRLAAGALNPQPLQALTIPWLAGLAMLLLGLLVGSLVNDAPSRWLIVALQYWTAYALLPLVCIDLRREVMHRRCVALIAGVTAMEAFACLVYWYTGGSRDATIGLSHEFITGLHRLGAFMADANWNSAMIAMTIPFVLYLGNVRAIGPLPMAIILPILIIALLLSGSFTGFVSALAAALTFGILTNGRGNWRPLLALVLLGSAVVLAGIPLPGVFQARVGSALETGNLAEAGTFVGRLELMKEAWQIVDSHTLLGLGADQYRQVSASKAPVHNIYLLLWAEGGLLSLLGWLAIVFVPITAALSRLRADRAAAALAFAVMLPFLAFSMASPHMYSRNWVVPLILATGVALARRAPDPSTPSGLPIPFLRVSARPAQS